MIQSYGEVVRNIIKPVLEEYTKNNNMGLVYYSTNRTIAIINAQGKTVIEVDVEHKNVRAPIVSDVKVCVEPYFSQNQSLHPNVRLKTRSFSVVNGEDHEVIAKKVVRFVSKLLSDFEKALKDTDEINNAVNTAKNNRAMAIQDALRNIPEMEYDAKIEKVRYKNYQLTPSLQNDEVLFEVKFGVASTKYVTVDVMKMILD